jgi:hypothetical protein
MSPSEVEEKLRALTAEIRAACADRDAAQARVDDLMRRMVAIQRDYAAEHDSESDAA